MMLPSTLKTHTEWTIVGPMGPRVPSNLETLPLIAVDGGARFCGHQDIWVGDADSYKEEITSLHVYRHPTEKDQSDLALAFDLFTEPRTYKFHLWGFLGGRRDHELFNLGEGMSFLQKHPECQLHFYGADGKQYFQLLGTGQWKFSHLGTFSLGTLKKTEVKMAGDCQYPISKWQSLFPLSSFGLSNQGQGEIVLENQGPVFLYFPEGK